MLRWYALMEYVVRWQADVVKTGLFLTSFLISYVKKVNE